jgi:hypothetical protein
LLRVTKYYSHCTPLVVLSFCGRGN